MDGLTLLRRAQDAGLAVDVDGNTLVIRGPRRAEPVARLLLDHKPVVISALMADWRAGHRKALAYWSAFRPSAEAAALAWGEIQLRWHRLHGARSPAWQCAGCRSPIGGRTALDLADGNRVHLDGLDCVLRFGERWRREATAGLRALGLNPPADSESGTGT
jgi:hypothetical protein